MKTFARFTAALILAASVVAGAQEVILPPETAAPPAPSTAFAGVVAEYVRRDANGHSPTAEDISTIAALRPAPDAAALSEAIPYLQKALASSDTPLRTFALSALIGLRTEVQAPAAADATKEGPVPTVFQPEIARALGPAVPAILTHLVDEAAENRALTLSVLAGFNGNAPPSVYPPLLAYLKRDEAPSPTSLGVVQALLALGPLPSEATQALIRFLRRRDLGEMRAELVDAVSTAPLQDRELNAALVKYLDAEDARVRARLILSLPQLDMTPQVFTETRYRVAVLAENPGENLQVINAAKAVAPCWTAVRMPTGCPVY